MDDLQRINNISGGQVAQNINGDMVQHNNTYINNEIKTHKITLTSGHRIRDFFDDIEEYIIHYNYEHFSIVIDDINIINLERKEKYDFYLRLKEAISELRCGYDIDYDIDYKNYIFEHDSYALIIKSAKESQLQINKLQNIHKATIHYINKAKDEFIQQQKIPEFEDFILHINNCILIKESNY